MKGFISPIATFLAVASINGAAATDSQLEEKLSLFRMSLKPNLSVDDWTSQLACTADLNSDQPSLIDKDACASTKDSDNQDCVWCDATTTIGQGVCLSHDVVPMLGDICAASTDATPVDPPTNPSLPTPPPVTPKPTPSPTPPPTDAAPVPAPDDDKIPKSLKCSVDASSKLISDEGTCVAKTDPTSTSGANCKWCSTMIGGGCIPDQSKLSFLCSKEEEEGMAKKGGNYLRGDNDDNNGGGWKKLSSSCLGDGLAGDEESCGDRKDSSGNPCIWCDAGDDVFGICATPEQSDVIGSYLTCAKHESPVVVAAVE